MEVLANQRPDPAEFMTEDTMHSGFEYGGAFVFGLDLILDRSERVRDMG